MRHLSCSLCHRNQLPSPSKRPSSSFNYQLVEINPKLSAHQLCLFSAYGLQRKEARDYSTQEIETEIQRCAEILCDYCYKFGASVKCSNIACSHSFHLACFYHNYRGKNKGGKQFAVCRAHRDSSVGDSSDDLQRKLSRSPKTPQPQSTPTTSPRARKSQSFIQTSPISSPETKKLSTRRSGGEPGKLSPGLPSSYRSPVSLKSKLCQAAICLCPHGVNYVDSSSWTLKFCSTCGCSPVHYVCMAASENAAAKGSASAASPPKLGLKWNCQPCTNAKNSSKKKKNDRPIQRSPRTLGKSSPTAKKRGSLHSDTSCDSVNESSSSSSSSYSSRHFSAGPRDQEKSPNGKGDASLPESKPSVMKSFDSAAFNLMKNSFCKEIDQHQGKNGVQSSVVQAPGITVAKKRTDRSPLCLRQKDLHLRSDDDFETGAAETDLKFLNPEVPIKDGNLGKENKTRRSSLVGGIKKKDKWIVKKAKSSPPKSISPQLKSKVSPQNRGSTKATVKKSIEKVRAASTTDISGTKKNPKKKGSKKGSAAAVVNEDSKGKPPSDQNAKKAKSSPKHGERIGGKRTTDMASKISKTIPKQVAKKGKKLPSKNVENCSPLESSPAKKFVENSPVFDHKARKLHHQQLILQRDKTETETPEAAKKNLSQLFETKKPVQSLELTASAPSSSSSTTSPDLNSLVSGTPKSSTKWEKSRNNVVKKLVKKISVEPTPIDDRQIYHVLNNIAVTNGEPEATESYKWLVDLSKNLIDEFVDLNVGEKEFFKLWNSHIFANPCYGDKMMISILEKFIDLHSLEIVQKNLYKNFILHLTSLLDFGILNQSSLAEMISRSQEVVRNDSSSSSSSNNIYRKKKSLHNNGETSRLQQFVTPFCDDKEEEEDNINTATTPMMEILDSDEGELRHEIQETEDSSSNSSSALSLTAPSRKRNSDRDLRDWETGSSGMSSLYLSSDDSAVEEVDLETQSGISSTLGSNQSMALRRERACKPSPQVQQKRKKLKKTATRANSKQDAGAVVTRSRTPEAAADHHQSQTDERSPRALRMLKRKRTCSVASGVMPDQDLPAPGESPQISSPPSKLMRRSSGTRRHLNPSL